MRIYIHIHWTKRTLRAESPNEWNPFFPISGDSMWLPQILLLRLKNFLFFAVFRGDALTPRCRDRRRLRQRPNGRPAAGLVRISLLWGHWNSSCSLKDGFNQRVLKISFSLDTAATVKPSFLTYPVVSGEVEGRSDRVFSVYSNEWLKGRSATEVVQYLGPSIMGWHDPTS